MILWSNKCGKHSMPWDCREGIPRSRDFRCSSQRGEDTEFELFFNGYNFKSEVGVEGE